METADKIPDDIALAARRITANVDGQIGSIVGIQIVARAVLAERTRCAVVAAKKHDKCLALFKSRGILWDESAMLSAACILDEIRDPD